MTLNSISSNLLGGFILSLFLTWLIPRISLERTHLMALIGFNLFVISAFSNFLEAYFFTNVFSSFSMLAVVSFIALLVNFAKGAMAGWLLSPGDGGESMSSVLRSHLGGRSKGSWILRIIAASIVYFPIYITFGLLISPFVVPYYSDPSLGFKIPPFTVMIPLQFFRGFLYVIALLPVAAAVKGDRRRVFATLAALLFVPGVFIGYVVDLWITALGGTPYFPVSLIPFHMVEILGDMVVYGYVLSRILGRKRR